MVRAAARSGVRHTGAAGDGYDRSDREVVGDGGWITTHSSPNTGVQAIRTGRLRSLTNAPGIPGSSGTIGSPICRDVGPLSGDVVDLSFDIVAGGITGINGSYLWILLGAGTNTGTPPTINSGVLLQWFLDTTANQMHVLKITATNASTDHIPGSFPACQANVTTSVRAKLTRSTGVVQIWVGGTLRYTSNAGDFSGLTGNLIGFQMQQNYASTPYEIDNVVVR